MLTSLHHLIDLDWMAEAYRLTRKDGAPDIDGVAARHLLAHVLDDLPPPRLAFERTRHYVVELAQPGPAALAQAHGAGYTIRSTGR